MHLDELQERKYIQVFEDACHFVARQRYANPNFSIIDLERLLDAAYTRAGNDWVGRGTVADIVNAATIAAYEHTLAEWRKELEEV
jgi:hypothetical protein